jgi:hypothetical protein
MTGAANYSREYKAAETPIPYGSPYQAPCQPSSRRPHIPIIAEGPVGHVCALFACPSAIAGRKCLVISALACRLRTTFNFSHTYRLTAQLTTVPFGLEIPNLLLG